jgi:tellurite methyltransferase
MDKNYWEKHYASRDETEDCSGFAKFIAKQYDESEGGIMIDVGCGNGRDTFHFLKSGIKAIGVDQSSSAIKKNSVKSPSFIARDICSVDYDNLTKEVDFSIYMRFVLHALSYEEENQLFETFEKSKNLKYLFIETRSTKDKIYGEGDQVGKHKYITSHHRRFIDPKDLKEKLKRKFNILYFEESRGFSKTEKEDPCLIRVIAKKMS